MTWLEHVRADPLPWLLAADTPGVRAATLQRLLDVPADAPEVREARAVAMAIDPIKTTLAAQDPAGWWVKPGPSYSPKYQGTVSQPGSPIRIGWAAVRVVWKGTGDAGSRVHRVRATRDAASGGGRPADTGS